MGERSKYRNTPRRVIDREAVAQSRRALELLFSGIKPPDGNAKARLQPGLGDAGKQISKGAKT